MTKKKLRADFESIADDEDIVELAEWGMADYAEIIAGIARP